MPRTVLNRTLRRNSPDDDIASLANAVLDVQLALRQRAKDLNRENHLRMLQTALHADSEKVWNMTVWYW